MTPHSSPAEPAPPRLYSCPADAPAAEVAEWLAAAWEARRGAVGVLLAAVPEGLHAAVAEGLRRRFARLEPLPDPEGAGPAAVRLLLDGGGTLVCGGSASPDGFQPSLFVHLRLSAPLVDALDRPAPVLGLAALEPERAAWQELLRRHPAATWGADDDLIPA